MQLPRVNLLQAIERVLPARARREHFDQANKVAFRGGRVVAFNDHLAILHPLPNGLDIEGAIDGKRFCDLLRRLSIENVDLSQDGDKLFLRAGRTRALFRAPPVTLPIDSVDMTGKWV